MEDELPSRTAITVALRRAAHQVVDVPVIFDDPLALRLVQPIIETPKGAMKWKKVCSGGANLRAFLAVRSRYAEDKLAEAVAQWVSQYVLLGAGLDTFACRCPYDGLRIFEIDHPASQRFKRRLFGEAGLAPSAVASFIAVDFEKESIPHALERGGFDFGRPAFFAWLGVAPYLTLGAIQEALRFIGSLAKGTQVVFDYSVPPENLGVMERVAFKIFAARVAREGEPFQTFFDPEGLERMLEGFGFSGGVDLDSAGINKRYFKGHPTLSLRGQMGRLRWAEV